MKSSSLVGSSLCLLFAVASCDGDGGGPAGAGGQSAAGAGARDESAELAEQLSRLKTPAGLTNDPTRPLEPEEDGEPEEESSTAAVDESGVPVVTTVKLQKYSASATYDTQILLNPATDVIYPGSVLIGSSIDDGSYVEVVRGTKNEISLSYGGLNGVTDDDEPGRVSGTIYPSLSRYRELHNEILTQTFQGANSSYTLETSEESTESAFEVHFAAGVSYPFPAVSASVKGYFDFEKSSSLHRYMVRFAQTYYTVDIDQGQEHFLYQDFDIDDFEGYRPVYVSSLAYGRLGFLTLESTESMRVIQAGVNAILSNPTLAVEVDVSTEVRAVQNSTNFNVTVIGSDRVVTTLEDFADFLKEGGFSSQSTGQIVAYKLRFVDDNSVANTIFNGEFTERKTSQTTGAFDVTAQITSVTYGSYDQTSSEAELYGTIQATSADHDCFLLQRSDQQPLILNLDGQATSVSGPVCRFSASSLNGTLSLHAESIAEDDGSGDDTYSAPDKTIVLGSVVEETEAGSGMYAGDHVFTVTGVDATDYVNFRVHVEAIANYPD